MIFSVKVIGLFFGNILTDILCIHTGKITVFGLHLSSCHVISQNPKSIKHSYSDFEKSPIKLSSKLKLILHSS